MTETEFKEHTKRFALRSKLGTVEEEADESAYWMELIIDGELPGKECVETLRREACELTSIMAASSR